MNVGSLFSGAGLLDIGLAQAGLHHAWGCESDPWRRELWERRFGAPCYSDIRELKAADIGPVDILAGGFPCRGVSNAGKREGLGHPETALWAEFARLVRKLQPRYVVVENVAALLSLKDGAIFGTVVGDLAESGFDIWWDCLPAKAFGAPHGRDRVFIVAHAGQGRREQQPEQHGQPIRLNAQSGRHPERFGVQVGAAADPIRQRLKESHGPESRGPEQLGAADIAATSAHAGGVGRQTGDGLREGGPGWIGGRRLADGVGENFDWHDYEPAIRRWEQILGRPAPPPLTGVHRLDDGNAAVSKLRRRVDRHRLSAHGDGVLVQAGYLVGRMVMEHSQAEWATA